VAAGSSGVSLTATRTGGGQVTITFDPTTDSCPVAPTVIAPRAAFTG
jgi:hypothetical protein